MHLKLKMSAHWYETNARGNHGRDYVTQNNNFFFEHTRYFSLTSTLKLRFVDALEGHAFSESEVCRPNGFDNSC